MKSTNHSSLKGQRAIDQIKDWQKGLKIKSRPVGCRYFPPGSGLGDSRAKKIYVPLP